MKNKFHWEEIKKLAIAHQIEEANSSQEALLRFLRFWWCRTYNRPFKDNLLMTYTADELTYEFLRHFYAKPENDPRKKIEAEQASKDDEAWVAKMLEQAKKNKDAAEASSPTASSSPAAPASPAALVEPSSPEKDAEIHNFPDISAKFDPSP